MRIILTTCFCLLAVPAMSDIDTVIDDHITRGSAVFSQAAKGLADDANADCTAENLKPTYHVAFDAWVAISHIRFGPIEENGRSLAVAFWPDKKGKIPKILSRMIKNQDAVVNDPTAFSEYSVAARGFFALEQMLFDPKFSGYEADSYSCTLTQAITADLARTAKQTYYGWVDGYAQVVRSAGTEGNTVFLTAKEGKQALYTNLLAGLEYIHAQRLGRPLSSFEKPRPKRAEAWRSNRSLRNIIVSLEASQEMALMLADGQADETKEAFASTIAFAKTLDDRVFANLKTTSAKFKLASLQELVAVTHEAATAELGEHLKVAAGFNALDGD